MAHSITWYIEPRVLYVAFTGQVTMEDIQQVNQKALDRMSCTDTRVHVIAHFTQIERTPLNAAQMRKTGSLLDQPNFGWMILVTTNPAVRVVGNLISQIMTRTRSRILPSMDEALALLKDLEPDIDWSQAGESMPLSAQAP